MSDNRAPDATRSGVATGTMPNRHGRLDGRAWRDVERAVKIGKKNDAYAVEVHGVRVLFKLSAQQSPQETTGGKGGRTRVTHQRSAPTCEPASVPPTKAPNSAQRRSARRLEAYLAKKSGQERTALAPGSDARKAETPAQVEDDSRMDAEPTTAAALGRGGQKRAAVEPTSCTQPTATAAEQQQQRQRVEPTPAAVPKPAARDMSPGSPRGPYLTTCRTCGGGPQYYTVGRQSIYNKGRWCKCSTPCYYERKVYGSSPGHSTEWLADFAWRVERADPHTPRGRY